MFSVGDRGSGFRVYGLSNKGVEFRVFFITQRRSLHATIAALVPERASLVWFFGDLIPQ